MPDRSSRIGHRTIESEGVSRSFVFYGGKRRQTCACSRFPGFLPDPAMVGLGMRYLVKARVKPGREKALLAAIEAGTLGRGSVAGDEYLHNMRQARAAADGTSQWVEVCFCRVPLEEERPYWEEFFELISVKDAHARRNCRDLNGEQPWACCDCDCTKELEQRLQTEGRPFLETL